MSKIPLTDGTLPQLRHFASVTLGLEIPPTANTPTILAKIKAVQPDLTEFDAPDVIGARNEGDNTPKRADLKGQLSTHYNDDPKATILIPSTRDKCGDWDVPVCVNGDQVLVQRDKEVEVPYRFVNALRDALEQQIDQTPARPGQPAIITSRMVHSYPFQLLDMPSKADIAEWSARMSGAELGEGQKAAA